MALGLRTSTLRIRGASTELEAMGEDTEGVITSVSKLEEKIKGLTNINGPGGVRILEDDEETFRSIYDIYVENIEIKKLIITLIDNNASIPTTTLKNFRNIEELTIDGSIDNLLSDEQYVLSKVPGLKKIHFICNVFMFESTFSQILSYFVNKKIILEISSNEVSVYDIMDLVDLQCIEEIIINDSSGRHSSNGNSIANFLFMYDESKNIASEPADFYI